jgi:hypothetical protein
MLDPTLSMRVRTYEMTIAMLGVMSRKSPPKEAAHNLVAWRPISMFGMTTLMVANTLDAHRSAPCASASHLVR